MTSPSPLLYNTYYHIYNRGTNRENIFIEERNYALFFRLYWKYSSYGILLTNGPSILHRELVMKWFGTKDNYLSLHEEWVTDPQSKWITESDPD